MAQGRRVGMVQVWRAGRRGIPPVPCGSVGGFFWESRGDVGRGRVGDYAHPCAVSPKKAIRGLFPYFPDCFPEKSPLLHSTARERSPAARPSVATTPAGWFFALAFTVEDFRAYIVRESYGLVERYRADGFRTGDTGCV